MLDRQQRAQLFSAAANDTDGSARLELFRALRGATLYYVASKVDDGSRLVTTRLRRLEDGTAAMVVYTSRSHPDLPESFVGAPWPDLLKIALYDVRPDWLIIANQKNETVAVSRDQIPVVIDALSQPEDIDASEALVLYLKHYPGENDEEFNAFYGPEIAQTARRVVRRILEEAMGMRPDWSTVSLNDAADYVESEMRTRHPSLTPSALESIGNYYTYLMR
jgi:hypothetical protein